MQRRKNCWRHNSEADIRNDSNAPGLLHNGQYRKTLSLLIMAFGQERLIKSLIVAVRTATGYRIGKRSGAALSAILSMSAWAHITAISTAGLTKLATSSIVPITAYETQGHRRLSSRPDITCPTSICFVASSVTSFMSDYLARAPFGRPLSSAIYLILTPILKPDRAVA